MTLALQKKRVNADTDKGDQQSRSEIILQMRDLHTLGDLSPQAFVGGALYGATQLADIISYACKR
jgi:hypothetical protein